MKIIKEKNIFIPKACFTDKNLVRRYIIERLEQELKALMRRWAMLIVTHIFLFALGLLFIMVSAPSVNNYVVLTVMYLVYWKLAGDVNEDKGKIDRYSALLMIPKKVVKTGLVIVDTFLLMHSFYCSYSLHSSSFHYSFPGIYLCILFDYMILALCMFLMICLLLTVF